MKEEGTTDINVVEMEPGVEKPEHVHEQATMHVILKGELTIEDENGKRIFKEGYRVDFPAGTRHSAALGPQGCCTMIVGINK